MLEDKIEFLEEIFGKGLVSNSEEIRFICPICKHHKKKFYINVEKDLYNCYYCGISGCGLFNLIKENGNGNDLRLYIEKFKAKNIKTKKQQEYNSISLPKDFIPLCMSNSIFSKRLVNYLKNRGIKEEEIIKNKIGTCTDGKYYGTIIFPSFDKKGNINYFTAKNIEKNYYMIPKTERGYKNSIIINELNINFSEPLLIVEGFIDAIVSGMDNVIPLLGSSLNIESKLFETIIQNNTTVFLALDSDAKEKSLKIAEKFIKYEIVVYNVNVEPYKDIGEMMKEEIFAIAYQNATLLQEMDILRTKINLRLS